MSLLCFSLVLVVAVVVTHGGGVVNDVVVLGIAVVVACGWYANSFSVTHEQATQAPSQNVVSWMLAHSQAC